MIFSYISILENIWNSWHIQDLGLLFKTGLVLIQMCRNRLENVSKTLSSWQFKFPFLLLSSNVSTFMSTIHRSRNVKICQLLMSHNCVQQLSTIFHSALIHIEAPLCSANNCPRCRDQSLCAKLITDVKTKTCEMCQFRVLHELSFVQVPEFCSGA